MEEATEVVDQSQFLEKWGFDLETLYKWALKFYKGLILISFFSFPSVYCFIFL